MSEIKKITLNGKEYSIKDVNFEEMCELEDMGLSLATVKSKPLTAFRALVAFYCDMSTEDASKEIEEHLRNGGNMDLLSELVEHLANSGFFRLLSEPTTKAESKKTTSKKAE